MIRGRYILLVPLTVLLLFCSACSVRNMIEPDVSLINVRFSDMSLFSTEGIFTIQIDNENNSPLDLSGSVHRIYLNGEYIGKAFATEAIRLAPLSSQTQLLNVKLSNLSMIGRIRSMLETERIDYKIESRFHMGDGIFDRSLTTTNEGHLDFRDLTGRI